jgi:hypothetical protein
MNVSVLFQDVGYAILESYSRTLESLAFAVLSRIEDVLHADAVARDPKRAKSRRRTSLESPLLDATAEAETAHHHSAVHWPDQDLEDGDRNPQASEDNGGGKLKRVHRVATKKFLHSQKIDVANGLRSFTQR